jgi:hypothetical protein
MAINSFRTRRHFLSGAAGAAVSIALAPAALRALEAGEDMSALRGRYLTHVSVVRVNQIEVTPDRTIGKGEASDNSPDRIRSRREAFAKGCPEGKMTWAVSWLALNDSRQE